MTRTISILFFLAIIFYAFKKEDPANSWIRINQLGYTPGGLKQAVWCSKENSSIKSFSLVDSATGRVVYTGKAGAAFGAYGPFTQTYRLDFSSFKGEGKFYLKAGKTSSPYFFIHDSVYKGTADFALRYMRQQRCGYNPYLKDSCHTHDGYTMYGPMPDSTYIDVTGGWHDASDYLQYSTTSANATYHLLMAWRDFPAVFSDEKQSNGLDGSNGVADIMDEAKWGLEWLLRMHPQKDWMFNQIADDRDHISMRIPKQDSQYGRGYQRPVYFINGEPQGLYKYQNRTKGTSSTAAKFAASFALAHQLFDERSTGDFKNLMREKAASALAYSYKKPGVTQTAPCRAPYFYEEENFEDDLELAEAAYAKMLMGSGDNSWTNHLEKAMSSARAEKITPWLGKDTARHYQWYPFINLGHYELCNFVDQQGLWAKNPSMTQYKNEIKGYYREGIQKVWEKARSNAFYRGIPYIWCSNNLTTSFAIQCYWYRKISGSKEFEALEQANFDWLFGLNPWGTSMVYGLPAWGDTPVDPHSAFTHLGGYPIDGGLVDGPVYTSIYSNLIGIKLYKPDNYLPFQSDLAVYHDDYGDYSTNEPTMDGTASLIYLLASREMEAKQKKKDQQK
jgi:endoglucanase